MNRPLLLFLTWCFPGLGHILVKSYRRACAYAGIILTCIVLGILLNGRLFVPSGEGLISLLASLADLGMGILYFIITLIIGYRGDPSAATSDYGTLFLLTAGMMNLLLLIEVHDIARGARRAA